MRPLEVSVHQRISGAAGRKLPDHPSLEGTERGCCSGLLGEVGDTAKTTEHIRSNRTAPGTGKPQGGCLEHGPDLGFYG
jgi:hypothetical protein